MASEERSNTIELHATTLTDVGVVRDHNEDSAYVDPALQFFVVADGMGGHAAGEVASAMAVDTVRETLEHARAQITQFVSDPSEDGRKELVSLLERAVRSAHQSVFERGSRETDKQGMGTTLDVVLVAGPEAFVAHVGDSRTYLIRDGEAAQITTDHTVAEVLVIEGKLSAEEAQMSPLRTILVNAIGVAADVGIEMAHVQLREGDELLLCSDGLHDYFPMEQELADRLDKRAPDEALAELISLAKDRGGHDNITGIIVQVRQCNAGSATKAATAATAATMPVPIPVDADKSDGVPASIAEDDTQPLDEDEEDGESLSASGAGSLPADEGPDEDDEDDDDLAERPTQPIDVPESATEEAAAAAGDAAGEGAGAERAKQAASDEEE